MLKQDDLKKKKSRTYFFKMLHESKMNLDYILDKEFHL